VFTKKWVAAMVTALSFATVSHAQSEPMATGKFEPTWESLSQYQVPEWYRNAKFGI
jgi:alpha-L-fucosidase